MRSAALLQHTAWPFFDDRHRGFAEEFGSWAEARLGPFEADEGNDGRGARAVFELLAAGGWLRDAIAGTEDGERLDLRRTCLMREILGFWSVLADVGFSEPWLAALPIMLFGRPDQKREFAVGFLAGRCLPAFALSEPEAGSDVAAIGTVARPAAGGYVLRGRKTWTSNCGLADLYVVFARIEGSSGTDGITAFLVDGDSPGVVLEQRLRVLPPHTVGTLRLDDCFVGESAVLGEPGQGFKAAMAALELFRPTVGAAALGMARRAMAEALARSGERVAFKKRLAEHQLIQEKLADMAVKTDAAALLVYRAAWAHDSGTASGGKEASIAKLYASESAQEVVDQALQIFGGLGVVHGSVVERLYRHVRAFRIFDGTSEIQKLIIAKQLLR
ncbi:MAG: acyl-CoA dehydrogenase [Pseudomonadota bacterium]